jgi:hypothetical protein
MEEGGRRPDRRVRVAQGSAVRPWRVGITGHRDLGSETVRLVDGELGRHLRDLSCGSRGTPPSLIGVSCLAPGADRVFADVVLRLGGLLEVILPWAGYPDSQMSDVQTCGDECGCRDGHGRYGDDFRALLRQASSVRAAVPARSEPQAYAAANDLMLDSVDQLVAVWNGVPSRRVGGTAHAVSAAKERRMPVTVIWPAGSRRG